MSQNPLIDLSKLPLPDLIETPNFETELDHFKRDLIQRHPNLKAALELDSEPISALIQSLSYRLLVQKAAINDAAKASMLASARGADLDAIGARFNVGRLEIQAADNRLRPPRPALYEDDERFRRRIQSTFDGLSTAGSRDAYIKHALDVSPTIKDVMVESPSPCVIAIKLLTTEASGEASEALLGQARRHFGLTDDGKKAATVPSKIRPLGDFVQIESAQIVRYQLRAVLTIKSGPSSQTVIDQAIKTVRRYLDDCHKLGHDVPRSGLFAALHQPGVENVNLILPSTDLEIQAYQAPYCDAVQVTLAE